MTFKDHFSDHAEVYAASRPSYPRELFEYLATLTKRTGLAWDCATGNGQSAVMLATFFDQVIATDGSASQIKAAEPHPKIDYRVALAEDGAPEPESADLVCVSQALHWFDIQRFFKVVDRALRPGGVLAVWSYGVHSVDPAVDELVDNLYSNTLQGFWPEERLMVEQGYSDIHFPYAAVESPKFEMSLVWSQQQLEAYLRSWSAVQKYISSKGRDPVTRLSSDLTATWGDVKIKAIHWPLTLIVRRKPE